MAPIDGIRIEELEVMKDAIKELQKASKLAGNWGIGRWLLIRCLGSTYFN